MAWPCIAFSMILSMSIAYRNAWRASLFENWFDGSLLNMENNRPKPCSDSSSLVAATVSTFRYGTASIACTCWDCKALMRVEASGMMSHSILAERAGRSPL